MREVTSYKHTEREAIQVCLPMGIAPVLYDKPVTMDREVCRTDIQALRKQSYIHGVVAGC